MSDLLPTTFGKYYLLEKLAVGGMAEVFLAKLIGPGGFEKELVIKKIHPELASNQRFIDLFVAEAKTTVSLNHPNIVSIFELGMVDETYFLAMEYVDGVTARELLLAAEKREKLPADLAAYICVEILSGLDYAHQRYPELVHRDISAHNIMVAKNGAVKILDFGLARARDNANFTDTSRPVGSYPYLSPEQASGRAVDHRSDLFSLGVVFWELLTSKPLFRRETDDESLDAVLHAPIASPADLHSGLPASLANACLRALERDPAKRFPTASDFMEPLTAFLQTTPKVVSDKSIRDWLFRIVLPTDTHTDLRRRKRRLGTANATKPLLQEIGTTKTFATQVDALIASTPPTSKRIRERKWMQIGAFAAFIGLVGFVSYRFFEASESLSSTNNDSREPDRSIAQPTIDASRAFEPPDAGSSETALPDAASRPRPRPLVPREPLPLGLLIVGSDVPATLLLNGKSAGTVPYRRELPIGRYRVELRCNSTDCPPDGMQKRSVVVVEEGKTSSHTIPFR